MALTRGDKMIIIGAVALAATVVLGLAILKRPGLFSGGAATQVAAYLSSVGIFTARNRLVRFIGASSPRQVAPRMVARAMCGHSLDEARRHGFTAMQFNFVVSTNDAAIALWRSMGFAEVGRLPGAFRHPVQGPVDALVMFQAL